jgi:oligoribonuclease NrnB/cAMP/cGMP phosphodiesterase (DHH superfamily)
LLSFFRQLETKNTLRFVFMAFVSVLLAILSTTVGQGCQIFLWVQTYQNGKNIPNDRKLNHRAVNYTKWQKIFQMVIKYNNIVHFKALQILTKLGFLVSK